MQNMREIEEMNRGGKLRRVRAQAMLVHRLNEQMRELAPPGLRSPQMTGMPSGKGGVPRGLDIHMERRDALERIIQRETTLLRRYEKAARGEMDGMKPEHYAFCALYYIGAMPLSSAAEAMGRSDRQCTRYKREIEEETA